MKNTIRIIGIIALLAVIGFSMVACDNGSTDAEGTFTITDIPAAYNGKYALFGARDQSGFRIWGTQGDDASGNMILTKINNGKAVIPLEDSSTWETYKGNDTFITNWSANQGVWVAIYGTETIFNLDAPRLDMASFASVKFLKGSAKKSWNDRLR